MYRSRAETKTGRTLQQPISSHHKFRPKQASYSASPRACPPNLCSGPDKSATWSKRRGADRDGKVGAQIAHEAQFPGGNLTAEVNAGRFCTLRGIIPEQYF